MFNGIWAWVSKLSNEELNNNISIRRNDNHKKLMLGFKVWTFSKGHNFVFRERLAKIKIDLERASGHYLFSTYSKNIKYNNKIALDYGLVFLPDGKSTERIKKIVEKIVFQERKNRKHML